MHLSTERKGHQIFFFFPFQHFSCHYFPRFQFPQRWLCLLTLMVFLSPSLDLSFPSLDSGSHHYQCPEPPNVNFKHLISLFSTLILCRLQSGSTEQSSSWQKFCVWSFRPEPGPFQRLPSTPQTGCTADASQALRGVVKGSGPQGWPQALWQAVLFAQHLHSEASFSLEYLLIWLRWVLVVTCMI